MKTAVKWLIDMLVKENEVTLKGENYKLFEQAKQMEKEQLKDAVINTYKDVDGYCWGLTAEEYFNEYIKTE